MLLSLLLEGLQNAIHFDILPYILGAKGPAQCVEIDAEEPMKVYLVPRQGGETRVGISD